MADVNIAAEFGRPVAAATASSGVILKRKWSHAIQHSGRDAANASATGLIVIGLDGQPKTADRSTEANKVVLAAGDSFILLPYLGDRQSDITTKITIRAASGAPILDFIQVTEYRGSYSK